MCATEMRHKDFDFTALISTAYPQPQRQSQVNGVFLLK